MRSTPFAALAAAILVGAAPTTLAAQEAGCPYDPDVELATRASPLDSLTFSIGGAAVKVCYGRPSARGRTMIGGDAVPYGRLWRTGANETTKIRTPVALAIAGIEVPAGTYALYTVPGEEEWTVVVNRSWRQWGHENRYTEEVRAREVGRATVPAGSVPEPIETFSIRAEPRSSDSVDLVLEWETTRVRIPIRATG